MNAPTDKHLEKAWSLLEKLLDNQINYPEVQDDVKLIAQALSDAAVIRLPERKDESGEGFLYSVHEARAHNKCLDEIKRLNNIQTDESGKD